MRKARLITAYGHDTRGMTLLEFALVAPVMFFMLIGAIEYSLFFFKQSHLRNIVFEASRNLQTGEMRYKENGELRTTAELKEKFIEEYCAYATALKCSDVSMDVRAFPKLQDVSFPEVSFNALGQPTNFVFQPGLGDEITVIRASIPHRFVTPFMENIFQKDGAPAILVGYSVAKNEPF